MTQKDARALIARISQYGVVSAADPQPHNYSCGKTNSYDLPMASYNLTGPLSIPAVHVSRHEAHS